MLPRGLVRNTPLQPTNIRIFVANGTPIPVMGTLILRFQVDGVPTHCNFLVSDAVDEPVFGIDWLQENNCQWDFAQGTIMIAGKEDQRCAVVVTQGQLRKSADEKEAERTSPHVQDAELENSTGRQGGAVVDPPVDSGRAVDPPIGDTHHHNPLFDGVCWTSEELQKLQADDRDIGPVVVWLKQNQRPPREAIGSEGSELKNYWAQWDSLSMVDGLVYRNFERRDGTSKYFQLLMPRSVRPAFLEMVHTRASGHFSWRKTQKQVHRRAYWASWKTDTKLYCACCRACNEFHRGRPPRQAGLKPIVAYSATPTVPSSSSVQNSHRGSNGGSKCGSDEPAYHFSRLPVHHDYL